ncbi:putative nucleoprotein [Wenling fish chu-like virus]|uniref:Putative nucleoprotein n=2 Tax=Riboviria TaxID=2559587 RepID=A0A2P1GMQ3_9VIRU|nr:putative nucleoprotein [Wenling fish chu-like virus]AVM87277.1 putative nucleoprotein [Wenling fish chu-like virus]AVM87280.1 putative nucleoprotein [Wenling fish chuvirus-like virus]
MNIFRAGVNMVSPSSQQAYRDRQRQLRDRMQMLEPARHYFCTVEDAAAHRDNGRAAGATRQYGPCTNVGVFGRLGTSSGLGASVLGKLDVAPFTAHAMAQRALDFTGLLTIAGLTGIMSTRSSVRRQIAILEALAPHVPEANIMPRDEARTELTRLLSGTNPNGLKTCSWFTNYCYAHAADTTIWTPATGEWADDTTLEEKLALVSRACEADSDNSKDKVLYLILLLMISFSMRGDISQNKMIKLQGELRSTVPCVNLLTREDVALTWQNFGHFVDERTIGDVLRTWMEMLPGSMVRLRVALAQAAGSGMVGLDTVARAMRDHPDFPWHLVARCYPSEWQAMGTAFEVVDGNVHYGFKNDLGVVKSSLYKSVSWFAGQLLMKTGDQTLKDYRGFREDPKHKTDLMNLIDEYIANSHQHLDTATDATEEELILVAAMGNVCSRHMEAP